MASISGNVGTVDSVLKHQYLKPLETPLKRPRTSPLYLAVLAVVTCVMLILPVVYVGLVGLVAYATYYHAVYDVTIFSEVRNVKAALIGYIAPLLVGVIAVLFMVKPLFAPRRMNYAPQALNRRDEPLLFAFVDRLCDAVGAPRPSAIHIDMDLNASASFAGLFSGLIANRLVLTVGLPLVASMSVTEFTAVLAHEFGHFAQRSAMRLSYIVRSISGWFARVVYERDGWDEALDNAVSDGGHWAVQLIALLAKLMVWLSRRVLWVLMVIGHVVSLALSRQMEYDADRFASCVVGTKSVQDMLRRLPELDAATQVSYGSLGQAWAERQLPDNFPAMVALRAANVPDEFRKQLKVAHETQKTGWLDTHPSTRDRVRSLAKTPEESHFDFAERASTLFTHFDAISKIMTLQLYRDNLGNQVSSNNLVPVEVREAKREAVVQQSESLQHYAAGLLNPIRAVFFEPDAVPDDADERAMLLMSARGAFAERAPAARQAIESWKEAHQKLSDFSIYVAKRDAGVRNLDYRKLGLASDEDGVVKQKRLQLESIVKTERAKLDRALKYLMHRLRLSLEIALTQFPTPAEETYDLSDAGSANPVQVRMEILSAMGSVFGHIDALRQRFLCLDGQLTHVEELGRNQHYVALVKASLGESVRAIDAVRNAFTGLPYPYANGSISLSEHLVPNRPTDSDPAGVMAASETLLQRYYELYERIMGDLAEKGLAIEAELGLEALSHPQA